MHPRRPQAQYRRRRRLQAVAGQLDLSLEDAPQVEQDAAGRVQAGGVQPAPLVVLGARISMRMRLDMIDGCNVSNSVTGNESCSP